MRREEEEEGEGGGRREEGGGRRREEQRHQQKEHKQKQDSREGPALTGCRRTALGALAGGAHASHGWAHPESALAAGT